MTAYIAEFIGTCILLVFGAGVVANVSLKKTLAEGNHAWLLITTGWGLAVFVAVFITGKISGAHLNPAVSVGLAVAGRFDWNLVPGYALAQFKVACVQFAGLEHRMQKVTEHDGILYIEDSKGTKRSI
ncbi:MAG: hypothetical protein EBS86_09135, partial [Crocinitomicaceae bacterium]|nr:hypothetical protein [Crocinitomicaceae bacterium]